MTDLEGAICGFRVERDGAAIFTCTDPAGHGGRLHGNPGACYDESTCTLYRGTHAADIRDGKVKP